MFWSIHAGKSVNDARKCVTTICTPSMVTTSNTFAAADGSSEPSRAANRCRSADDPTSR
jgi:hypothetical protein